MTTTSEEKALFVPHKEYRNGREYREHTKENIRELMVVASLRRTWFTMDEIKERPALSPAQWKEPLQQGLDDSRVCRQFVASAAKTKHCDLAVAFGQFNEAMDAMNGGGTVAMFMANRNILILNTGAPVLSMHAPIEAVSKLDCYMTQKAMRVFYQDR